MSRVLSATKSYASPVTKRCFKQKYSSKSLRRMVREQTRRANKAKVRSRKSHVITDPETGKSRNGPRLKPLVFKGKEPTRATGALKRSERHPRRRLENLTWSYVSR